MHCWRTVANTCCLSSLAVHQQLITSAIVTFAVQEVKQCLDYPGAPAGSTCPGIPAQEAEQYKNPGIGRK